MGRETPGSASGTNVEGESPDSEPTVETDEATITEDAELERTLGLSGGLAIGIGTMIGAGIFVFPGLAAGREGPAAASFVIGAVVALLVALPASELATAMPKSGGGYYFISRGLGALAGAVVGLSLWFGLVFATAFYLVGFGFGFGFYAVDALAAEGVDEDRTRHRRRPVRGTGQRRGGPRRRRHGRAGTVPPVAAVRRGGRTSRRRDCRAGAGRSGRE